MAALKRSLGDEKKGGGAARKPAAKKSASAKKAPAKKAPARTAVRKRA